MMMITACMIFAMTPIRAGADPLEQYTIVIGSESIPIAGSMEGGGWKYSSSQNDGKIYATLELYGEISGGGNNAIFNNGGLETLTIIGNGTITSREGSGIITSGCKLVISAGENGITVEAAEKGILADSLSEMGSGYTPVVTNGELSLSGKVSVTTTEERYNAISSTGSISINDGAEVTATSEGGCGISTTDNGAVTIGNATVTAEGASYGIYSTGKLTINNGAFVTASAASEEGKAISTMGFDLGDNERLLTPAGGIKNEMGIIESDGVTNAKKAVIKQDDGSVVKPDATTVRKGAVYNAKEQDGYNKSWDGFTWGGTAKATNAGNYDITATLDAGKTWSDGSADPVRLQWTIAPLDASDYDKVFSIPYYDTPYYDGKPKTFTPVMKIKSQSDNDPALPDYTSKYLTLTPGVDYDVRNFANNIDPGITEASYEVAYKGNYCGTVQESFSIYARITDVVLSPSSFIYNGQVQKPDITVKSGEFVIPDNGWMYGTKWSDRNSTEIGTYTVTVTGYGAMEGSYAQGEATGTYKITDGNGNTGEEISVPIPAGKNLTYNGKEQTGVAAGEGYTLSGTKSAKNAGSYKATATLKEGYIWTDGTTEAKAIKWTIKKATKSVDIPKTEKGLVYNKKTQTGVKGGSNYTLSGTVKAKNAGKYTATAKLKTDQNYTFKWSDGKTGNKTISWSIGKAANTLSVKGKTAKVKYSKLKDKDQNVDVSKAITFKNKGQGDKTYTKSSGSKKITIGRKTGKIKVKKGLKKGSYEIKVKVKAAGNDNYKASAARSVKFTIKVR